MEKSKPKEVEAYIVNANPEARPIMEELRKIITSTVPEAEEGISWNVPIYKYHGILAGFSVARHHVSFGVDALQSEDRKILAGKGYKTGKKTIQIKFGQKVPNAVILKILKRQAKINEIQ
ncbi:iron chaperone [Pricia sp.]|uniref:iron chaperone n=1 Tax=Pricia sp. TaxID=2268138 RepID=UPI0035936D3B